MPLCAAFNQLVISLKAAIWLRITMSGFVMSTSTSGFDTWLARPLPMTTDWYLWTIRSISLAGWQQNAAFKVWVCSAGLSSGTCSLLFRSSSHRLVRSSPPHTPSLVRWTRTFWHVSAFSSHRLSTETESQGKKKGNNKEIVHISLKESKCSLFWLWVSSPVDLNWSQQQWWAWHQGCKGGIGLGKFCLWGSVLLGRPCLASVARTLGRPGRTGESVERNFSTCCCALK